MYALYIGTQVKTGSRNSAVFFRGVVCNRCNPTHLTFFIMGSRGILWALMDFNGPMRGSRQARQARPGRPKLGTVDRAVIDETRV